MRSSTEWLGLAASFTLAAVLEFLPLEWIAVLLSVLAIMLSAFAYYRVTKVVRQLSEVAEAQAHTIAEVAEKADAFQNQIAEK